MQYIPLKPNEVQALPFMTNALVSDNTVKSLEITVEGKQYLIEASYGITVSAPAPDEMVDRYKVDGFINGVAIIPKVFDQKWDADQFAKEYDGLKVTTVKFNVTKNKLEE